MFHRLGPEEALQHSATWQKKWVSTEHSEDHPPPLPNTVPFSFPCLHRACTLPCKLQVSLIIPNTTFNECLHQPRKALCFWAKAVGLLQIFMTVIWHTHTYTHWMAFWWSPVLPCQPPSNPGKMMGIQMMLPCQVYSVFDYNPKGLGSNSCLFVRAVVKKETWHILL